MLSKSQVLSGSKFGLYNFKIPIGHTVGGGGEETKSSSARGWILLNFRLNKTPGTRKIARGILLTA